MIHRPSVAPSRPEVYSFAKLMQTLGETFAVRDVMVPLSRIEFVAPDDEARAKHLTPLAEAFFLFESREWYFTLRGNKISGLITYWAFNSREFRVQLYAGFSRIEELSRDLLAKDGCGVSDPKGLNLTPDVLEKAAERFESARREMGGNRFVDELQFHQVHDALRAHTPWRDFLLQRTGKEISNREYNRLYNFTGLRDGVMHGRVLFPIYGEFKLFARTIDNIAEYIGYLDAYVATSADDAEKASSRHVAE
jgi:hypothetical protein